MNSPLRRPPHMTEELVLGLLASSRRAWSAYEIAGQLSAGRSRIAPAQVYRALARLCDLGQVRRIESLNAYAYGGGAGLLSLLCHQCKGCDTVEAEELTARIQASAREVGFEAERLVLEIWGLCARCGKQAAASALLLLCTLPLVSGEALACPFHSLGGMQRFGPFDAAGGWRGSSTDDQIRSFDTEPTATQRPEPQKATDYRQEKVSALQEEAERGRGE